MRIRYTVTVDDMIAFVRYHFATSPEVARITRAVQLLSFLIVFAVCVVLGLIQGRALLWLVLGAVIGVGVAATYPVLFIRLAERTARRMHTADPRQFGERELLLEGDALIDRELGPPEPRGEGDEGDASERDPGEGDEGAGDADVGGEQKFHVSEVMRLDHTAEHVFIYLADGAPRVIRRSAVSDGDLDWFCETLESRI
ncbi:MAG: hypothetical protein KC503_25855 [Myxococcales bacterium]|nr:hypothetical protein [Myxococcales bacterium]